MTLIRRRQADPRHGAIAEAQIPQWRPPPPDFDGEEKGNWEDQVYSRSLTAAEHDALADAGWAEPPEELVTIAQDQAERDAFFAALATPARNLL